MNLFAGQAAAAGQAVPATGRRTWMMKQAIGKLAFYFNSHRMMRR